MNMIGHIGQFDGHFDGEPLARVVEDGKDFFNATIDDVKFDSRYPIMAPMLQGDVVIPSRNQNRTITYPQFIIDLPFVPIVLCMASVADNKNITTGAMFDKLDGSGNPTFKTYGNEATYLVKDENNQPHPEHLGPLSTNSRPLEKVINQKCVTPFSDIDEWKVGGIFERQGFQAFCYTGHVRFKNYYYDALTITYHVMNIGA